MHVTSHRATLKGGKKINILIFLATLKGRKDTGRAINETPFRRVHALRVVFPRSLAVSEDVRRAEKEVTRERERERERERGKGWRDACASNNDVFRCSALYTAWRSMPVLTPAQGRSGRAGRLAGAERRRRRRRRKREGALRGREGDRVVGRAAQARSGKNEQTSSK